MSRRVVVTALLPQPDPEPTYPEYEEVREEARRSGRGPIGMQTIDRMEEIAQRRGGDWCTAVLGRSFPGIRHVSTVDGWTLIVADTRNLDPALPPRIVEERAAAQKRREERELLEKTQLEMAKRRWNLVAGGAPVVLTVHENTRHAGAKGHLRHVVPTVDVVSGKARKHKGGMGLCETPGRSNPLRLGKAVDLPPNCVRCVDYAAKIRCADAPAPPTDAEVTTLRLISSGVVFTLRAGRSQPTIRDTSQRSRGTRGGALGRKVDARVKQLQDKGWAAPDAAYSATQTGQHGQRWRLTEAGTAALEG